MELTNEARAKTELAMDMPCKEEEGKSQLKRLPVGIQTYSNIIEGNMLYIDKTEYIWNMINLGKYIFLPQFGITECLIQYKCSVCTPPPHAIRSG